MYSKFNVTLSKSFFDNLEESFFHYKRIGQKNLKKFKKPIEIPLYNHIGNGVILGDKIKEDWFPKITGMDIFLSHSHQDESLALAFAGYLNEVFNLNVFIDSAVWGYADELKKELNNKFYVLRKNKHGSTTYSYKGANLVSTHVDSMLSVALGKMMDKTECMFFLNTRNSIECLYDDNLVTYSPWLMYELSMMEVLRITKPKRKLMLQDSLDHREIYEANSFKVKYNVDSLLKSFKKLDKTRIFLWKSDRKKFDITLNSLDLLYMKYFPEESK